MKMLARELPKALTKRDFERTPKRNATTVVEDDYCESCILSDCRHRSKKCNYFLATGEWPF